MKKDRLDILSCHRCQNEFQNEDLIFSIYVERFDTDELVFPKLMALHEGAYIIRCIRFHEKCFEAISGRKYMP